MMNLYMILSKGFNETDNSFEDDIHAKDKNDIYMRPRGVGRKMEWSLLSINWPSPFVHRVPEYELPAMGRSL